MSTKDRIIKCFAILLAISIILGICNLFYTVIMSIVPVNTKIVVKEYKKEFKNINSLDIKLSAASLTIKQNASYFNVNNGDITITVPKELKDVLIKGGAGKITISDLTMNKLNIEIGAGRTDIDNIETKKTKIEGGAGSLNITSSKLNDLKLSAGAGSVSINSYIYGDSKIECGIGRTNISLFGKEDDYQIKAKKGLGNLIISGKEYGNEVNYGNGKNKIQIEGGIGEISVRFKK